MARTAGVTEVDDQIRKKQEKLYSLKDQYDAVADEIQKLLKKKEEMQKAELLSAYEKSGRTFEEVMEFLRTVPSRTSTQAIGRRKDRPKRLQNEIEWNYLQKLRIILTSWIFNPQWVETQF